jgi:hypothetical protein
MPHATSPTPSGTDEDVVLPDAPEVTENGTSSEPESAPGSVQDEALVGEDKENMKVASGLDEMFDDDDDEDDDFTSSNPQSSLYASQTLMLAED